jgi:hypothetical protein
LNNLKVVGVAMGRRLGIVMVSIAVLSISLAMFWYTDFIGKLSRGSLHSGIEVTPTTATPISTTSLCTLEIQLVEALATPLTSSATFVTKPFKTTTIQCPENFARVVLRDDYAVVYIDKEVDTKVRNVVWKIWIKQGYRWGPEDMEQPPNTTIAGTHEIVLKKVEGYSTRIVVEITTVDGSVEIEEVGIGGYIPETILKQLSHSSL